MVPIWRFSSMSRIGPAPMPRTACISSAVSSRPGRDRRAPAAVGAGAERCGSSIEVRSPAATGPAHELPVVGSFAIHGGGWRHPYSVAAMDAFGSSR